MSRINIRRPSKRNGAIVLVGVASVLCSSLLLSGSAALEDGGFFIHAVDADEPRFKATAGMNGTADGGGTVTPPDGDQILATYSCGPGTFSYTQSMKDLTESNLALHEAGRDSEMETGPGGWEAVNVMDVSAAELGADATIVLVGDIELARYSSFTEFAGSENLGYVYDVVVTPRGNKSHTLNVLGSPLSNNSQGISFGLFSEDLGCNYSKQVNGELSSLDGSPAAFSTGRDVNFKNRVTWTAYFAKDGDFYRDGGKPEIEVTLESDAVEDEVYPMPAYSLVGELKFPANTDVATSSYSSGAEQTYSFTDRAYSEAYPTS